MNNSTQIDKINSMKNMKFNWRILGENFVFKHENMFYKMPSFVGKQFFYRGGDSYTQVQHNFELIKKYFGKVIPIAQTEIIKNTDGNYIIKQKAIKGHMLTKKDLSENYILLSKFKKLIIINEIMWKEEGVFLDLLGSDFALQPNKIHNLISYGNEIYIFDFGLFEKKPKNIIFKIFSQLSTHIQMFVIKHFWDK